MLSCLGTSDSATLWTVAPQSPLSLGPPLGDLLYSGIELVSPELQADSLLLSHPGSPSIAQGIHIQYPMIKHNGRNMKKNIYITKSLYCIAETTTL